MIANLPSQNFQPRVYGLGAWTDNLHFAYDLMAAKQPRQLVELGTDRGESYFAFCQAAAENETATRCFAVDTWRGDSHSGAYDETTFAEVARHNRAHYADFSTLLRADFDAARARFETASVDLLHIDGLHTEAAVRHDFETWLPKVAPGGIILFHDVAVRRHDFGVWKLWAELQTRGRFFTFENGPGLGVWEKPPAIAQPPLLELLFGDRAEAHAELVVYYQARARAVQERLARAWRDGTIRQTAHAQQTSIQVFHSRDGTHSEENSITARIGHDGWKEVVLQLPADAGAAPLRLDFYSALTVIDLSLIRLTRGAETLFAAEEPEAFNRIRVAGDAERRDHSRYLRIQITGVDPQLYFPTYAPVDGPPLALTLRLRVSSDGPPAD